MQQPRHARSFSGSLTAEGLQHHILRSYLYLRIGIAVIGVVFPLLLLFGGMAQGICPQDSMSAYYHAVGPVGPDYASMRNWFVGLLFAVSVALGLYGGFSRTEDWLLNAAAILGIGIAIFPMPWTPDPKVCGSRNSALFDAPTLFGQPLHDICAIAFFVCIALVCGFCADDTLCLVKSPLRRLWLKRWYRALALLMPGLMFVAWALNSLANSTKGVFWVEASGIFAFAAYWFSKGIELNQTAADFSAATGHLRQNAGEVQRTP